MIEFDQGDRVLIEDDHAIYTGEVLGIVGMIRAEAPELIYLIQLDSHDGRPGRALLTCRDDLWPEHPSPIPGEPADVEDGSHEWSRS